MFALADGRGRALLIALGILVVLVILVVGARVAAGSLRVVGDLKVGDLLTQTWVTSVVAFVIGACGGASAYALDASGSQAIYAAFAAALVAALFGSGGSVIRPGDEEEIVALRWLGAITGGVIAGFLVVSLLAASALALDPSLPRSLAEGIADAAGDSPSQQAAFEREVERLVLALSVGTLFAALTVLLLRGIAESERAANERKQIQEELQRVRELLEGRGAETADRTGDEHEP